MTSAIATGAHRGHPPGMAPASTAGERWIGRFWYYLPAVLVFAGTIAVWEVAITNIDLRGFPLPAPTDIVAALAENWAEGRWPLGKAAAATQSEAVGGLAIGTLLGVALAPS